MFSRATVTLGIGPHCSVMLVLLSFFFFLFLTIAWSKEISDTTRPIFTNFLGVVDTLV